MYVSEFEIAPYIIELRFFTSTGQPIKKAAHGGDCYSEASKEAEVGAGRHNLGSKKAQGIPVCKMQLLILSPNSQTH